MGSKTRENIEKKFIWALEDFYASVNDWEIEFRQAEEQVADIEQYRGRLGEGALTVRLAIETYLASLRRAERLYSFSHMRSDEDTSNSTNLSLLDRAGNLFTRFSASASFLLPELLDLPPNISDSYLVDDVLKPYHRMLKEIVRFRSHTLSRDEENLLALGSEVFSGTERIFSQLNNADFDFGTIKVGDEERPLTHGSLTQFLKDPNRELRLTAFNQFYKLYDQHKNTITATLATAYKADVYLAQVRKYKSALEKALFPDYMPIEVYTGLVEAASDALPELHEYYKFRAERLKLKELTLADTHVPLVEDVKTAIPYEEAIGILLEAFAPLGDDYCKVLEKGLRTERWVDVYETKGKRSGAYCSGCYDSYPFMLMNYKEDQLSDLFTLAHEIGHAMHAYLTNHRQPYQDHHFGIFVAEVASTFNEQLLLSYLRRKFAGNKAMIAYLLNHQLDEIKGTFFRQTMFAEFESKAHKLVEEHQSLTTESLAVIYTALLKKYFGPAVTIEDKNWLECLRIPHFYNAYYVYKYATGISAAISLSEKVLSGVPNSVERYLNFLSSGCTKPPLELLQDAGVDMTKPDAVRMTTSVFSKQLHELRRVLN